MPQFWSFRSAGQLVFGPGSIVEACRLAQRRGWRRALLVSDATLAAAGIVDAVAGSLRGAGMSVECFTEGEAEPSLAVAERAREAARVSEPDTLVALGGGSNLDLAKITAVLSTHGGEPADYFGFDRVPGPVMPLIAVPTTAGTGSEVSHAAVLTDTDQAMKVSALSHYLRPELAVVDPEYTWTCPPKVTADSGIDALTHAVEAATATDFDRLPPEADAGCAYEGRHPLGDCLAERAVRLIAEYLVRAVRDGGDREARSGMALAATLAGLAFSNCGVALVHALEYPLGGRLHCSHGAGNGLLLPYVMRFNLPERTETFARIAAWLGVDTSGMDTLAAASSAVDAVERLRSDIGIPHRIRELGGSPELLPEFAAKSFAIERLRWINPRAASEKDLLEILQSAW